MKQTVEMPYIAIAIVAYNRADSVRRLLNSLLKASYIQPAPLIISIDKSDTDAVEQLADEFQWPYGEKIVAKHTKNMGLRRHILSIGDYTKKYDAVIVLEDDLEVSPSFYHYAVDTVTKYQHDNRIAGISLYTFPLNLHTKLPFIPEKNEYDAFLFQNAQSWGQIWMTDSWAQFVEWYENNSEEFSDEPHLPLSICHWGKNSWLKYHIKYCIEKDKYFVYPYTSLTFCSNAAGVHSIEAGSFNQNPIIRGIMKDFRLPAFEDAVKYDGFYERVGVDVGLEDVCFDINGSKGNRLKQRYWLTTIRKPYKVVSSYGLLYIPIEENIINRVEGNAVFLYDTHEKGVIPPNNFIEIINFYKLSGLLSYMRIRGFFSSILQLVRYIIHRYFLYSSSRKK